MTTGACGPLGWREPHLRWAAARVRRLEIGTQSNKIARKEVMQGKKKRDPKSLPSLVGAVLEYISLAGVAGREHGVGPGLDGMNIAVLLVQLRQLLAREYMDGFHGGNDVLARGTVADGLSGIGSLALER